MNQTNIRRKQKYYYKHLGNFRRELREAIPREVLRELHQPVAWKHFAIVLRQVILAVIAIILAVSFDQVWIWLPCSIVIGFVIFDFTVLLHEVIHKAVFRKNYPSGRICWAGVMPYPVEFPNQFTRWHLDHVRN